MKQILKAAFVGMLGMGLSPFASAVALNGTLTITPGEGNYDQADAAWLLYSGGSYFSMDGQQSVGEVPKPTWRPLVPGSAGGITLGQYQNFVLDPNVPHPAGWKGDTNGDGVPEGGAGGGYNMAPVSPSTVLSPFDFFGKKTYVGTNPISYQSGQAHGAPSADISDCVGDVCTLTMQIDAWEVMWNGNAFEQGPRPDNTGPFTTAVGNYNLSDQSYSIVWTSEIKGGAFDGVTGTWYLEGTFIPAAIPEPSSAGMMLAGLMLLGGAWRYKNGRCA